ncbi:MAG: Unknown protein [uncultured Sulfurovum sp.]|uniref:Dinitrogenase iron-molybdenum cofactor biosynthesis domain-containing protein n=1 Tax=uncultured Sulfurovum sp. TaxID=269237 RepID=A0A6S6TR65_9BACT|nr:MAG: Unknown protein [uncultured Sulfurovum sp.]
MLLIPLEKDATTIASRFRKADMFVFIDTQTGIVFQENHFKTDKSKLFFENFKHYDVDTLYVKELGYNTYLKLHALGVQVSIIPKDVLLYTHIDPTQLTPINHENAKIFCTLGHHEKEHS